MLWECKHRQDASGTYNRSHPALDRQARWGRVSKGEAYPRTRTGEALRELAASLVRIRPGAKATGTYTSGPELTGCKRSAGSNWSTAHTQPYFIMHTLPTEHPVQLQLGPQQAGDSSTQPVPNPVQTQLGRQLACVETTKSSGATGHSGSILIGGVPVGT